MPNDVYLDYNNELIDDGHPLMTQYGSKWAVYLLGAAIKLTDRETWNQNDDVDLAVEQATELIVRLMGYEEEIVQKRATSPVMIHPFGMKAISPETVVWNFYDLQWPFKQGIFSSPTDQEELWTYFRVWLPTGNFTITFYMPKGTNYGKVVVSVDGGALLPGTLIDLYSATSQKTHNFSQDLFILTDGLYTFTLEKKLKNPSSSDGYLSLFAVIVGEA